jgi:FtsP/CotA-like multicopper oxidase with cupredoxin domain
MNHDAGLCGDDVGLNIFKPRYFLITGTPTRPKVSTDAQKIVAGPKDKILVRLLNASYSVLKVTLGVPATIVGTDGNSLNQPWNEPVRVGPNDPIFLTTAQRRSILIDAAEVGSGTFKTNFEFQDWLTRKPHNPGDPVYQGTAFTTINIS